jgi:hypothetical protein
MNTTAVKDGDEWVINGAKTFITNGGMAGFYNVLCQTDPDAKPGYRGMSVILVEAGTPGLSTADVGQKMGIRMMATTEVILKDVRVPLTNLIGEENKGFYQVLTFSTRAASRWLPRHWERPRGRLTAPWHTSSSASSSARRSPSFRPASTSWPTWPPKSNWPG